MKKLKAARLSGSLFSLKPLLYLEKFITQRRRDVEKQKFELVNFVDDVYGFNLGVVLFKPTLASVKQFRTTKEGALSYFIGGNANYPEDHGFAINPWSAVRWENIGIKIVGNMAVAMGNYYFTPALGGEDVKVEYSFAYTKDDKGKLRIILHDSHLPYAPEEKH